MRDFTISLDGSLDPADRADIVQDVFHAILNNLGSFRRDRPGDKFRAWLWTITRNKTRDHFRRRARHPGPIGGTDAQQQIENATLIEPNPSNADSENLLVHRALDVIRGDFADQTWQAFWRAAVDGQKAADVAEDLGMTKGAVRQAQYRVLRRLRDELDGFE